MVKQIFSGLGIVVALWLVKRLVERKQAGEKMVEIGLDIGRAISALIVAKFKAFEDKLENIIILIDENLIIPFFRAIPVGLRENNQKKQIRVEEKGKIKKVKEIGLPLGRVEEEIKEIKEETKKKIENVFPELSKKRRAFWK